MNMDEPKSETGEGRERAMSDELRELLKSFSALGRTMFEEGRVLSVDLLRSAREAVDKARGEIERLGRERK
jgi:hypothetical protein